MRIKAHQGITLEVVLQESEQDVEDDASTMPDLELLSIADPDDSSYAQNEPMNALDVNEAQAALRLLRIMEEHDQKSAKEVDILKGEPLRILSTLAFSDSLEMQQVAAGSYYMISTKGTPPCTNVSGYSY